MNGSVVPITDEELSSLKEAFTLYDIDKQGAIDLEQFGLIVKGLKLETNDNKIKIFLNKFDKNSDGQIDFEEFVNAMTSLVAQPEDITFECTSPSSTSINEEYKDRNEQEDKKRNHRLSHRLSSFGIEELKLCFEKFDKNGDGLISKDELKDVMNGLGETLTNDEINDMMKEADTNLDGYIDFSEFTALKSDKEEK